MNFAIIPWENRFLQDKLFDVADKVINVDDRQTPFYEMKLELERQGHQVHTVDLYEDLLSVDYFLFFEKDLFWLEKIIRLGLSAKMIYCNAEPPSVNPLNCPKGYEKIKKYFPYILTWNDEWVDEKIVFKRNIPYYFQNHIGRVPFIERKLLTSISGNKRSTHPDELYSERERVLTFFENSYPDDIDFYGTGWEETWHPCYRGKVDKKYETFWKYRFALCFENIKNMSGYVTEKILDCLTSGIVPIYAGAPNIDEYIPKECYIDYWQFSDSQQLADFLFAVDEERFNRYLQAAKDFLASEKTSAFSGAEYAGDILLVTEVKKEFHVSWGSLKKLQVIILVRKCKSIVKSNLKRALGRT